VYRCVRTNCSCLTDLQCQPAPLGPKRLSQHPPLRAVPSLPQTCSTLPQTRLPHASLSPERLASRFRPPLLVTSLINNDVPTEFKQTHTVLLVHVARQPYNSQGRLNDGVSSSQTHHTQRNSSGRGISPTQRPLTAHSTHNRQTSMPHPRAGFEPTIPVW